MAKKNKEPVCCFSLEHGVAVGTFKKLAEKWYISVGMSHQRVCYCPFCGNKLP